ncbi:MAG: hypothetical protein DWI29_00180 [Planctomycetota bacterium]|nr:MAG: hypothetical protein DWI29_00180 [Planctomycetota bacterium]
MTTRKPLCMSEWMIGFCAAPVRIDKLQSGPTLYRGHQAPGKTRWRCQNFFQNQKANAEPDSPDRTLFFEPPL